MVNVLTNSMLFLFIIDIYIIFDCFKSILMMWIQLLIVLSWFYSILSVFHSILTWQTTYFKTKTIGAPESIPGIPQASPAPLWTLGPNFC